MEDLPSHPLATGRSREEIDVILSAAKLDRKDLLPVSQEIAFAENFSGIQYRLIELPKEVAETVRNGNSLVFRGDANEHAVLCTGEATYEIKEAETSNSLLIFKDLAFPEEARRSSRCSSDSSTASSKSPDSVSNLPVIPITNSRDEDGAVLVEDDEEGETVVRTIQDIVHSYFELKKITPSLSRITNILARNCYKGVTSEDEVNSEELITFDKLLEMIPASAGEISGYLKTIRIMDHDGSLQLIDDEYLFRVFSLVANLVDENSWRIDRIPKSVVITTLISLEPPFVIDKIFQWFFHQNSEDNDDIYCMKENEICRFYGEVLLKPVGRFHLKEFMRIWQDSVPEGLKVNLNQLEGTVVTNAEVSPPAIWYFPEYNLPESAADRFAVLFDAKPKWKLDEITAFLRNLPSCQSAGVLLTKFARVNSVNGVKYYSSKHSK